LKLSSAASVFRHLGVLALATGTSCLARSTSSLPVADEHWHLRETRKGIYEMTVVGARDALGSAVSIRADSAPARVYGQAEYGVPIHSVAPQRISITADIRPRNIRERAAIWLRADRNGQPLLTEYAQIPARGTSDWQHQETGFVVPDGASSIAYGVLLQGSGEVFMQHLTVEATALPPPGTGLSTSARGELDSALHVARANAIWHDTLNWPVLEARVWRAAAGAREPRDVYPAIRLLATALADHHSSFYTRQDMITFRSGANLPTIEVRVMSDGVGYVNSPGFLAEHHDSTVAYVRRTFDALEAAAPAAPCGWVIDLRGNTGGTPEPMFAALEPFFGPDAQTNPMQAMVRRVGVVAPTDLRSLKRVPVALLLGPQTGSAGERVALAFRQRPRARSFGQPTAGVASSRRMVLLPDGAALAIATSPMDTTLTREKSQRIAPDVVVGDQTDPGDRSLRTASAWVAATGCSARTVH
jgi:carboxyl-terminal processing protease